MSRFRPRPPSPALVVATVALFVAMGGTGYAAFKLSKNSVGSKQLKNGAVTTSKLANGAVTKKKLNVTGVTVPNALHANNADNATNAGHATNSDKLGGVAASGYQPALAYARVNADGTVVASQTSGVISVTHTVIGLYCFQLNVAPHVASAIPEHISGQFDTSAQASVRPDVGTHTGSCLEPNRDASVIITGGGTYGGGAGPNLENGDFMVIFG